MDLTTHSLLDASVGYGELGINGNLGYENNMVTVGGRQYTHALSAHGPSRLCFALGANARSFSCQVALNDDSAKQPTYAHFAVLADGRQVAAQPYVTPQDGPLPLNADITGATQLELVVTTARWEFCHSVWLEPRMSDAAPIEQIATISDPLGRATITLPACLPKADRCIATVVSPGFADHLDDMLGSLRANGACEQVVLVVFVVDGDEACHAVAAKYGAQVITCSRRRDIGVSIKSVLYAVARVVQARQFLCLDADMLVLNSLAPIFAALDSAPQGSILVCREGNAAGNTSLLSAIQHVYRGNARELQRLVVPGQNEEYYPLVVNDGLFAGTATALLALDGVMRRMPKAIAWMDEYPRRCWWRNQFLFNLALARLRCGVALDNRYNLQLHVNDVNMRREHERVQAYWHGQAIHVLHFCGTGRNKYPEWRGLFTQEPAQLLHYADPLLSARSA